MRRLLLVRHAQSEWNASGRWQGTADPGLSPDGRDQARRAGQTLAAALAAGELPTPVAGLRASDLRRAVATAEALGAAVGWPRPAVVDPRLREHDVGEWSGLTRAQIDARWPGAVDAWSGDLSAVSPGGERRSDFEARAHAALAAIAAGAPAGLEVVVTHGGVLRAMARWLGVPDRPLANLEGYLLDADGPRHVRDVLLLPRRPPLARDAAAEIP